MTGSKLVYSSDDKDGPFEKSFRGTLARVVWLGPKWTRFVGGHFYPSLSVILGPDLLLHLVNSYWSTIFLYEMGPVQRESNVRQRCGLWGRGGSLGDETAR